MKKYRWYAVLAVVILIQMTAIFYLLMPQTCKRTEVSTLQVQATELISFTDVDYGADGLIEYEIVIHQDDVQVTMPFRTIIQQYHQGNWYDLQTKHRLSATPVVAYNAKGLNSYNWYDVDSILCRNSNRRRRRCC